MYSNVSLCNGDDALPEVDLLIVSQFLLVALQHLQQTHSLINIHLSLTDFDSNLVYLEIIPLRFLHMSSCHTESLA